MSIVYAGAASVSLSRDAMLASANSMTIMAWLYPTALPGSGLYYNAFAQNNNTNTSGVGVALLNSGGTTRWDLGTASTDSTGSVASANVWKHLALTKSAAASQALYLGGVSDATDTASAGGTRVVVGNFSTAVGTDVSWNGRIAAVKMWDAVLTVAEIQQEMQQYLPVRTANLKAFFPFLSASELTDFGGQAQSLTTNGTAPTSAEGPPIPWRQQNTRIFYVPAAVGGTTFTASLAGSVTSLGTIAKAISAPKAGSVTSSGSAAKAAAVAKAGSVTSVGAATKRANKAFAGSSTSSGALSLVRAVLIALAGSVTSTGTLTKSVLKSVVGSCTSAGTIAKQAAKGLTGSITSSGALAKLAKLAKAGSVTASGVLTSTKVALLALAGSVTSSGTLARSTLKSLVGACTSAGTIAKANAKGLVGSVTSSGALRKLIAKAYAGSVTSAGVMTSAFLSGLDLIIGLIGTFVVPTARILFYRREPAVTMQDASPSITVEAVTPDATNDEPSA